MSRGKRGASPPPLAGEGEGGGRHARSTAPPLPLSPASGGECHLSSPTPHHKATNMLGHNRKMSGAQCLADMLKGYGVTHVFHVPAVLRKTFAVMETRTTIKRLH